MRVQSEEEALRMLGRYQTSGTDHQTPGMDGIEVFRLVREREGDPPFIPFSGTGLEDVVIRGPHKAADLYCQTRRRRGRSLLG